MPAKTMKALLFLAAQLFQEAEKYQRMGREALAEAQRMGHGIRPRKRGSACRKKRSMARKRVASDR